MRHDEFDRLIEQKDQELALSGQISPFTQQQLQAHVAGQPVPQIDLHAPALEQATARLFKSLRALWGVATEDDDDLWFEEEA